MPADDQVHLLGLDELHQASVLGAVPHDLVEPVVLAGVAGDHGLVGHGVTVQWQAAQAAWQSSSCTGIEAFSTAACAPVETAATITAHIGELFSIAYYFNPLWLSPEISCVVSQLSYNRCVIAITLGDGFPRH